MEETSAWLPKMVNSKETNGITDFVITLKDAAPQSTSKLSLDPARLPELHSGMVIGKIGIYAPLDSKSGELGFMLNRGYHRRGLVSEALSVVLDYLFEQVGVEAISTDVDPRNEASIGILEKYGFVFTGSAEKTFEIGGEWVDSEFRTLTKQAWRSR
jgi:[ribosomal protein S5]-alanine N-acetyltransferase